MRGRLPLPPFPGQPVGGGVPDAPRRLAPPPFPGLLPAETCADANLRGGVKTPPYKQTRKPPSTQTPGPGMPGPYRAAARERVSA